MIFSFWMNVIDTGILISLAYNWGAGNIELGWFLVLLLTWSFIDGFLTAVAKEVDKKLLGKT